ncbi:hypothetical protein N7452_006508, partial [Penicillium brevicompactum]
PKKTPGFLEWITGDSNTPIRPGHRLWELQSLVSIGNSLRLSLTVVDPNPTNLERTLLQTLLPPRRKFTTRPPPEGHSLLSVEIPSAHIFPRDKVRHIVGMGVWNSETIPRHIAGIIRNHTLSEIMKVLGLLNASVMNHTPHDTARRTSQGSSGSPGLTGEHRPRPEKPVQPSVSRYISSLKSITQARSSRDFFSHT